MKNKSTENKKCKICDEKTKIGFNINLKLIPICESCANSIFLQQANWFVKNDKR